jgi:hypothetical protein
VMAAAGCAEPPRLERDGYELARALYAVCNRKSTEQLDQFVGKLEEYESEAKISSAAVETFAEIVALARDGQWVDAQEATRDLLASQNP